MENEVVSFKEMMEEKSPYDGITYHVKQNYISIKRDGHEFYDIDKERMLTEEARLHWLAHLSEKPWVYPYHVYRVILKAIKEWKL